MALTKNFSNCTKCVTTLPYRQFNSGTSASATTTNPVIHPSTNNSTKMQAKSVVLSQWKLVDQLKSYISKFSRDDNKTFESVLNKEFAHFLQKIQPTVYGSDIVRYFESLSVQNPPQRDDDNNNNDNKIKNVQEAGSGIMSIPSVLNSLIKLTNTSVEEVKKPAVPKWKATRIIVSKDSVVSRTQQILTMLIDAESDHSKLARIEDLLLHIKKYPEAKHTAVKDGAIRLILKIKDSTSNRELEGACNEGLAQLGYVSPVSGNGVRILSIDGGGVRGILVIEMLKKLEELTGKRVHDMFDVICGVSTGAIIATLIGTKEKSLDEIYEIYRNLSTQIFTQSAFKGTSNLVWSHSYYDTALWEKLLQDQIGDQTLISTSRKSPSPKLCALSAVVNQSRLSAYIFRNYSLPIRVQSQYLGSHEHLIWEAVRASAAAPTYFEEFKLGNMLHQDGGILFNNPTAVAIHEAKLLWPSTPIQCVLSFGTGRTIPTPIDTAIQPSSVSSSSWKHKFYSIIESATDTEGVHTMLSDLLPDNAYYRFNPYLTEMLDIAEIRPEKIEQLKRDAIMYLRRNEDKFQEAARALNLEKNIAQKSLDWLSLKAEIHGFIV